MVHIVILLVILAIVVKISYDVYAPIVRMDETTRAVFKRKNREGVL